MNAFETELYMVSWVLSYSLSWKPLMFDSSLKRHLEFLRCMSINVAYNFSRFLQNISDCKGTIVYISCTSHFCMKSWNAIYYVLYRMCLTMVFRSNKIVIARESRINKTHKTVEKVMFQRTLAATLCRNLFFSYVIANTEPYDIVVFLAFIQNVVKT